MISRYLKDLQKEQMGNKDARTRLMNEILTNIRSIKVCLRALNIPHCQLTAFVGSSTAGRKLSAKKSIRVSDQDWLLRRTKLNLDLDPSSEQQRAENAPKDRNLQRLFVLLLVFNALPRRFCNV